METVFKPGASFSGAGGYGSASAPSRSAAAVAAGAGAFQGSADLCRGRLAPILLLGPGAMSLPLEADLHGKRSHLRDSICGTAPLVG